MENRFIAIIIALTAAFALTFSLLDQSVWPWDPAYYGEVTLQLYDTLGSKPGELWQSMISAFGFKAPGIAWLGMLFVPLAKITGSFEPVLLWLTIACGLLAAWILFCSVKGLSSSAPGPAFIATLHLITAPLFVGLMYNYFTEQLQLLSVCIIIWSVAARHPVQRMIALGLIGLALGMLAKASTPLYILAPCVLGLWRLLSRRSPEVGTTPTGSLTFWIGALLCAAGAAAWYIHNWEVLRNFIASTSSGSIAELYGKHGAFGEKLSKWLAWSAGAFFVGTHAAFTWIVIIILATFARLARRGGWTLLDSWAALSAAQCAAVLGVFSLQVNEETRYLLPALPYVASLTAFAALELGIIGKTLLTFCGLSQMAVVHAAALGSAWALSLIHTPWLKPFQPDPSAKALLTEAVHRSCPADRANRYSIIALELPYFNANTAAFYSAKNKLTAGFRCFYTSLGYAESDVERALARLKGMQPEAVVYLHSFQPAATPDPFNAVSQQIRTRIASDPAFQLQTIPGFEDLEYYDQID